MREYTRSRDIVEISSNIASVWKMVSDLGKGIILVIKRVQWRWINMDIRLTCKRLNEWTYLLVDQSINKEIDILLIFESIIRFVPNVNV